MNYQPSQLNCFNVGVVQGLSSIFANIADNYHEDLDLAAGMPTILFFLIITFYLIFQYFTFHIILVINGLYLQKSFLLGKDHLFVLALTCPSKSVRKMYIFRLNSMQCIRVLTFKSPYQMYQ